MVAYTQLKVTSTWDFRAGLSVLNLCISYSQEEGKKKKTTQAVSQYQEYWKD